MILQQNVVKFYWIKTPLITVKSGKLKTIKLILIIREGIK